MPTKFQSLTGGPSDINLSDLHDVAIVSPQTGQYLRYNASISEWQNSFINTDLYNFLNSNLTSDTGVVLTKLSGPQSVNIGLSTLINSPGTFGTGTQIPVITVNAQGRISAITTTSVVLSSASQNIVASTTTTVDCLQGINLNLSLGTNITTLSIINEPLSGSFTMTWYITQASGGSHLISWPGNVLWSNGTPPTLTTTSGKTDILRLTSSDAGATYYGSVVGLNF